VIPSPKLIAAVGTVLVAAAFAAGRLSAPKCAPSVDFDHSRDVLAKADEKAKGAEVQQLATQAANTRDEKRKTTKTVKKPDGTVAVTVDEIESHAESTSSALATARRQWETDTQKQFDERERTWMKVVAAARPDWSVTAVVASNVLDHERIVAALVSRRLFAAVDAVLFASTRGDVGGGVAVRW
jgi:hypothetical protein